MVKLLRVNMTDQTVKFEDLPAEYQGMGGRGLTSLIVTTEVDPTCYPLGPLNKLVFAPGLLGGTNCANSGRISVGAKSPLTGGIEAEQTLSELAARFDLHPNMIAQWKRQATEGMSEVFSSKGSKRKRVGEAQIKELHAKIGQLTIERDFLAKASGR